MKVLVIGSGGREHALAWKLSQSPRVDKVFIAPGNGGTCEVGENIDIAPDNITALVDFAKNEKIDLVVPGPEMPLVNGIVDAMNKTGISCFGPDKYCAQLEGSKSFAKKIMEKAGVPTASYQIFSNPDEAREYAAKFDGNIVIKADGLAAGKGVVVASSMEEASQAIDNMLVKKAFGNAGASIILEERLNGEEVSLLCLCDGETAVPLPSAQDHKTAYDHDQGPNTGGMGAYSPAPLLPDFDLENLTDIVIRPILKTLADMGHPFTGVLYAGLMITRDGPKVLEYNARFGDPECQPLMLRLQSDLASHLKACAQNRLKEENIRFSPETALGVILAAEGYPEKYEKGFDIAGIDKAQSMPDTQVFHCGTCRENDGVHSTGGRVLCVTAKAPNLPRAQARAYDALKKISMPHSRYRRDIGLKGIMRIARMGEPQKR